MRLFYTFYMYIIWIKLFNKGPSFHYAITSVGFRVSPGRALIHVFNNPSATEGYLSWGYLSKNLEFFTPYQYR